MFGGVTNHKGWRWGRGYGACVRFTLGFLGVSCELRLMLLLAPPVLDRELGCHQCRCREGPSARTARIVPKRAAGRS